MRLTTTSVDVAESKTGNTFAPQSVNMTRCGHGYALMNIEEAQDCENIDRMYWNSHLLCGCMYKRCVCSSIAGNTIFALIDVC